MKFKYVFLALICFSSLFFLKIEYCILLNIFCYVFLKAYRNSLTNFIFQLFYTIKYLLLFLFSKSENKLYNKNDREQKIIVSLTTYNKRIKTVFLAIESLFRQNIKANKIILWLDENEFTLDTIPDTLKKQIKKGLEIKFYKNIKSYKKIVPSLKLFPNDIIITADDDIFYRKDFIEKLYINYLKDKTTIYCYYSFKFLDNNLNSTIKINDIKYYFNYIGTGGGVLFPPNILPNDIFDEELFMRLAPINDDIFISVLIMRDQIKFININKNPSRYFINLIKNSILNTQDIALFRENCFNNKAKEQLESLLKYYELELYELF